MNHLSTADLRTPTWGRLTKVLQDRLQELRELNDASGYDQIKTAAIRGQIAEVKRLLALSKESVRANEIPHLSDFDPSQ